jgi:quinol monooxygenase YgiN
VKGALKQALIPTLQEAGCEGMFETSREGDVHKLVFFEIFSSSAAHKFHLEQDYMKRLFTALEGKLAGAPKSLINAAASVASASRFELGACFQPKTRQNRCSARSPIRLFELRMTPRRGHQGSDRDLCGAFGRLFWLTAARCENSFVDAS